MGTKAVCGGANDQRRFSTFSVQVADYVIFSSDMFCIMSTIMQPLETRLQVSTRSCTVGEFQHSNSRLLSRGKFGNKHLENVLIQYRIRPLSEVLD